MMKQANLTNHFLIAMPSLEDPNFYQTVTYICEHNSDGAMGIVINKPIDITLEEVFMHMDITTASREIAHKPVFRGGPVQTERGFVIHQPATQWESTLPLSEELGVTTSRDILEAIASGEGPEQYLIALGYAGWGAGQLEEELASNSWLSGPADLQTLFATPAEERWRRAAGLLGVDLTLLSHEIGHA